MKIAIDINNLKVKKTGIGYYTYNIVKALEKVDKINDYELVTFNFFLRKKFSPFVLTGKNFKYKIINWFPGRIYSYLFEYLFPLPIDLLYGKKDIFFFPHFVSLPLIFSKSMIVIYDLSYIKYPQYCNSDHANSLKKYVPRSIKKSSCVVVISENTKKDVMSYYGIPENKIAVIPCAVSKNVFRVIRDENLICQVKKKYKIEKNYLFFASTLEPRKNIVGIIKSYISLPEEIKRKYSLVLAGGKGWQDKELLEEVKNAQDSQNGVIQTGYVPEEDLPILYSGASLFLYPSFYEGFGIPILEAMSCGTPVITSNISSMPEVAGDAACLVDPYKISEIREAIIEIISNKGLREGMIEKGFKQIKSFSWEESARKLVKAFEKVYTEEKNKD